MMTRTLTKWTADIEEALEEVSASSPIDLFLQVPGLRDRDLDELNSSVRAGLSRSVLHLVLAPGGETSGVGRELQSSISRRRPVVWLTPSGQLTPRSVQAGAREADIEILEFTTSDDLRSGVRDAVRHRLPTMRELLNEKDAIPVELIELQGEMRRRWLRASTEVLDGTRITAERAALLLTDPFVLLHDATLSELLAFSSALGMEFPTTLPLPDRAEGGDWVSAPRDAPGSRSRRQDGVRR